MAKSRGGNIIGAWAFLIGVLLAIILGAGLVTTNPTWVVVLVFVGIILGLLNIADEEVSPFLISGAVLIIASSFGQDSFIAAGNSQIIEILTGIFNSLLLIFVPATIVVAIKNVFSLAKH